MRRWSAIGALAGAMLVLAAAWLATRIVLPTVGGANSDAMVTPIDGLLGDRERGRRIVRDRTSGNCLICHEVPEPAERFMGNVGPPLTGIGGVLSAGQLRFRVVDAARLNPQTVMPPYYRVSGLTRVAPQFVGKPVLNAQQVEDVVAYLAALK